MIRLDAMHKTLIGFEPRTRERGASSLPLCYSGRVITSVTYTERIGVNVTGDMLQGSNTNVCSGPRCTFTHELIELHKAATPA